MSEDIIALLRREIENKHGKRVAHGKDCKELSERIQDETSRTLSTTTLKRFFELVNTPFKPSKYTLETLALYLGFEDWEAYLGCFDSNRHRHSSDNTWDLLKKRVEIVTQSSLKSIKLKTKYSSSRFLLRSYARKRFKAFENSSLTATMFVAPDGYGKSSTIVQLVEKFLLSSDEKYKDDIVCLIDGGIFFDLFSSNSNVELLKQLLEFKLTASLPYFFNNHPEELKGRIWIIIDDIDEIFFEKEQYRKFVENLMRLILGHNQTSWSKIILTCRPENMEVISYLAKKNPTFNGCWFGMNFCTDNLLQTSNIPAFSEKEIKCLLRKLNFEYSLEFLKVYHSDVLEVIQYPNFLSIFVDVYKQKTDISEIDLLNRYVEKRLFSQPYLDEKILFLEKFLELSHLGELKSSVSKEEFPRNLLGLGYDELISHGIVYEYTLPHRGILDRSVYIKFCQNLIFEFIVVDKWLKNENFDVSLFEEVRSYYRDNTLFRCQLMQLMTLIFLHYKEFNPIVQIHSDFEKKAVHPLHSLKDLPQCIIAIGNVVRKAMRNNKDYRKHLIPKLSKIKIGQILYFKESFDVDGIMISSAEFLSDYKHDTPSSDAFFHFMQFIYGLLSNDSGICGDEYFKLKHIRWEEISDPSILAYGINYQVFYRKWIKKDIDNEFLEKIIKDSKDILLKQKPLNQGLPKFELSVLFTLSQCQLYKEVIAFSNFLEINNDLSVLASSSFFPFYRLCLSHAFLQTGKKEEAYGIFDEMSEFQFPENMKFYFIINVNLLKASFYIDRRDFQKAGETIETVKHYALLLRFPFFIDRASEIEQKIHHFKNQNPKEV
ncbi:hypothetical protein [Marinilabilia rubra]|uniref:NACHT domain-containing protein n=1 Tax=Marinilabilia rubra TaxID=2162893 RepID=A0A2U2BEE9_9BACT|nr:hypothetical protein [Marinilabilia rubra]PWE01439.1 hypothetical protein DDZ16_02845 [Marinilabilia rubra]